MDKPLTPVARKLRRASTDVETALWQRLRNRQLEGEKFVRQLPIGPYVADFACRSAKLVIELDGGQHADSAADAARTGLIEAHGYTVLRFWNNDVIDNIEGVLEQIRLEVLNARNL
jgi:BirA family biotin operon repressor/biotin-[acetyl-CoA-carboxylase] ligase